MPYFAPDDCGAASGLLQHLGNEELKQLLNDEGSKVEDMVRELPQVKALESEREILIASNKSLAEYNLSREPSYRQTRQQLFDSHQEATALKRDVERKRERLEEFSRQTSIDTTLALLQTAAAQAEEETELLASTFLSGDLSLDPFLSQFLEKRKLSHLRRIKTEKLMEYVRSQPTGHANASVAPSGHGPVRPAPPPPFGGSPVPPYPMGAPSMPQPGYNHEGPVPSFPFSRPSNFR